MQNAVAELKVKGGKLVRVKIAHEGNIVFQVQITGGFFIHPEEGLDVIERALVGLRVSVSAGDVEALVNEIVTKGNITIMGFSPNDLAKLVAGALA